MHTRLQKLAAGEADATLLALAGLRRLGIEMKVGGTILNPSILLPAVGQGAVGVQCRIGDQSVIDLLSPLNDPDTESSVTAERALLAALDGSCRTPIGGLAQHQLDCNLHLQAMVATPDGTLIYRTERTGPPVDAARMGDDAGRELRAVAGGDIFP